MIINRKSSPKYIAPILLLSFVFFSSACSTPKQRAEREINENIKIMEKIRPIGSAMRNMSKEDAYLACDQKSEAYGLEARKIEEMQQSIDSRKNAGGLSGGIAQGLANSMGLWAAKANAKKIALKSCLIDYGYIML